MEGGEETASHREMRMWRKDGARDRWKQIKMSSQLPFTQEHVHERGEKKSNQNMKSLI